MSTAAHARVSESTDHASPERDGRAGAARIPRRALAASLLPAAGGAALLAGTGASARDASGAHVVVPRELDKGSTFNGQFLLRPGALTTTGVVTGGTGAYAGARGTVVSRKVPGGSEDTLTLLP
jgi:hypothetical protein